MISEKEKLRNQFEHFKYALSCKRSEFISNFESYENFMFKLYDKYDFKKLEDIESIEYLDFEKMKCLNVCYLRSKKEYQKALLDLYNFCEVRTEILADIGFISTECSLEELRSGVSSLKRHYRPSKV